MKIVNCDSWRFLLLSALLVAVIAFGSGAFFGRVIFCDLEARPIMVERAYQGAALYCRIPMPSGWGQR